MVTQKAKTVAEVGRSLEEMSQALKEKMRGAEAPLQVGEIEKNEYKPLCSVSCPVCGGSGWFRQDVPVGHKDFGKLFQCPNVKTENLPGSDRYGLFPEELQNLDWDAILPLEHSKSVEASNIVKKVIKQGWGWVYLYGDHGQAKSLILKIAVAVSLRKNTQAAYANMAEIIKHMRLAFDSIYPSHEAESRLDWWRDLPILAIDEFDRINNTKWASEQQFLLMDDRNVGALRRQSITLIASNASPMQLDSYYRDRILDGRFHAIELRGESARLGMTQEDLF